MNELPEEVIRRLAKLDSDLRGHAGAIALLHPNLANLIISAPGLLAALAAGVGSERDRAAVRELIVSENNIKQAWAELGLAGWLRSLQPEAFSADFTNIPASPQFTAAIQDYLPGEGVSQRKFIDSMQGTFARADEAFCIWLAREMRAGHFKLTRQQVELMAVFSWISRHDEIPAAKYLRNRWRPASKLRDVARETGYWLEWNLVDVQFGATILEPWRADGTFGGFDCKVLRNGIEFREASLLLDNCLYRYGERVLKDMFRVVTLSKASEMIGAFEIHLQTGAGIFLQPLQIHGRINIPLDDAAQRAMYAFLAHSPAVGVGPSIGTPEPLAGRRTVDLTRRWTELFAPYFEAKGSSTYFPATLSVQSFSILKQRAAALRGIA